MSRYTGPRVKIARRFDQYLPGMSRKSAKNRTAPPGQHGMNRRRKASEYKERLDEKQKLRFNFGITERQLRRYFKKAKAQKGNTGHNLLQLLESRLDNVLFRSGLAPTIPAARQIVNHGHVNVDGKKVDIPSFQVKPGQKVSLRDSIKKMPTLRDEIDHPTFVMPAFLIVDKESLQIDFVRAPERDECLLEIKEDLIIEFYNRVA